MKHTLPTLVAPTFELTLPSTGKTIKYRPFLVKEEKILLMSMESGETKQMSRAIRQIIDDCTNNKLDVDSLPLFDVEYIFLQLRSKSVGETAEPMIICPKCKESTKIKLNIAEVEVQKSEDHDTKIKITDQVGVVMNYPQLKLSEDFDLAEIESDSELAFDVIIRCIDQIWSGEDLWEAKEVGLDAVREFVDNMSQEQFTKVAGFFETMPQLKHVLDFTCPHCKDKMDITLQGLNDFFDSPSATTI
jgi:phage FluMu protein Com